MKCDICNGIIEGDNGMRIITAEGDRIYCTNCLMKAFDNLQNIKYKTPDVISLLSGIRTFLKRKKRMAIS